MLPIFSSIGSAASSVGSALGSAGSAVGNAVATGATNAVKPYSNLFKGGELTPTGEVLPSAGQQLLNVAKDRIPGLSVLADATGMNESHPPISQKAFEQLHPDIKAKMDPSLFKGPETMAPIKKNQNLVAGLNMAGDQSEVQGGGIANSFLGGFGIGK